MHGTALPLICPLSTLYLVELMLTYSYEGTQNDRRCLGVGRWDYRLITTQSTDHALVPTYILYHAVSTICHVRLARKPRGAGVPLLAHVSLRKLLVFVRTT
jgi:hypothetical protein